jgi:hypothetical protein
VTKTPVAVLLLLASVAVAQNKPTHIKPETPHLAFVTEYVRELISDENIKTHGLKELSEAKTTEKQISTGIYFSRSVQLELRSQIRMLNSMRLAKPFETLIPSLVVFYQHQVELHQSLIDITSQFIGGQEPGIDYPALAAKMPQIRAELDQSQKAVFEATPLIFMALVDEKPDSQNHLSHLSITKAEKSELQDQLLIILKDEPEKEDHDYYISSAMILRAGLQKGHLCVDEPWE